jgi:hypothetical protein
MLARSTVVAAAFVAVLGSFQPDASAQASDASLLTLGFSVSAASTADGILSTSISRDQTAAARFVEENRIALTAQLSMGAGPTLVDLGELIGVPEAEHGYFARAIRARRNELLPLLAGQEATTERASAFLRAARRIAAELTS